MSKPNVGRMDPIVCVRCKKPSDAYTQIAGEEGVTPGQGDVIICFYCGQIMFWEGDKPERAPDHVVWAISEQDPDAYKAAMRLEVRWQFKAITEGMEL